MASNVERYMSALVRSLLLVAATTQMTSCLNTQSKSSGTTLKTEGEAVLGISPWSVQLTWTDRRARFYNIRELTKGSEVLKQTPFLQDTVETTPGHNYQYRVTPEASSGNEAPRSFEFGFRSWPEFTGAKLSSETVEQKGLVIRFDYAPWEDEGAIGAMPVALENMVTTCAYLKNGLATQDPLKEPSAYLITGPTKDGLVVDKACALPTSSDFLVSCQTQYSDGKLSVATAKINARSPSSCVNPENLPKIAIDKVQVAPYPGFLLEDLEPGKMDLKMVGFKEDSVPQTESNIWEFGANFPEGTTGSESLDVLSEVFHAGYGRVRGNFTAKSNQTTAQMVAQDFYIKSGNDRKSAMFPPVISVAAAQQMGESMAVGDFNCDRADDLAIGMPATSWEDDSDPTNIVKRKTGVVIIFYAQQGIGLNYSTVFPTRNPVAVEGAPLPPNVLTPIINGAGSYNGNGPMFGYSLAVGNFNRDADISSGDQCDDLVIGAPYETFSKDGVDSAGGSVYIAYGGKAGLRSEWQTPSMNGINGGVCVPNTVPANSVLPTAPERKPLPINGAASGCDGLHVFAPRAKGIDTGNSSSLWYAQSGNHQLDDPFYLALFNNIYVASGYYQNGWDASAEFGYSVAASDFNGDGFDDLIVGAPKAQHLLPSTNSNNPVSKMTGAGFVFFGGDNGVVINTDLDYRTSGGLSLHTNHPPSPIKIMPERSFMARYFGSMRMGHSVGGGNLRGSSDLSAWNNKPGGSVFFGMPYFSVDQGDRKIGAVAVAHWETHFKVSPLYLTEKFPVLHVNDTQVGTAADVTFKLDGGLNGEYRAGHVFVNPLYSENAPTRADQQRFGEGIAVGNFRDPREGDTNTSTLGVDVHTSKPYNQVLAVGTPGYNSNRGAVYLFTKEMFAFDEKTAGKQTFYLSGVQRYSAYKEVPGSPAYETPINLVSGTTDPFLARQNGPICQSADTCRAAARVTNPSSSPADSYFGSRLSVAKVPYNPEACANHNLAHCFFKTDVYYQIRSGYIDSLLVASGGDTNTAASNQTGVVYPGTVASGIGGAPLTKSSSTPVRGERFGGSIAAGYFKNRDVTVGGYDLVIGAPNHSQPVPLAGNVYLYNRDFNGALASVPINLAMNIKKESNTASHFNYSSLSSLGFQRSKPVGDMNCDGFMDIAMPVEYENGTGERSAYLLFVYGSPTGLNYKDIPANPRTSQRKSGDPRAPHWLDLNVYNTGSSAIDVMSTYFFAGVGNVNGDTLGGRDCDDLVIGRGSFYIFYGSSNGVILDAPRYIRASSDNQPQEIRQSVPSTTFSLPSNVTGSPALSTSDPNAETPTIYNNPDYDYATSTIGRDNYHAENGYNLPIKRQFFWGYERFGDFGASDQYPFCHGDYNGDGFNDVVIGTRQIGIHGYRTNTNPTGSASYQFVGTGANELNGYFSVYYGSGTGLQLVEDDAPRSDYDANCSVGSCSSQRLFYPPQFWSRTWTNAADEDAFYPYRPWREYYVRHSLVTGSAPDSRSTWRNHATAPISGVINDLFGRSCVSVGDIDKDGYDDLVTPLPDARSAHRGNSFVIFFGSPSGLRQKDANMVRLTKFDPADSNSNNIAAFPTTSRLGQSGAGVGDVNNDTFPDFVLGAPGSNSFVLVFGGPNWRTATSTGSVGALNTGNQPAQVHGGDSQYEKWRKLRVANYSQSNANMPACVQQSGVNKCWAVMVQGDSNVGFGEQVSGAGDINEDGFGDILISTPRYTSTTLDGVGGAIVYFGDSIGIHTKSPPTEKARCKGSFQSRTCSPLRVIPKYAQDPSIAGFESQANEDRLPDQNWRARSGVIYRSSVSRQGGQSPWFYPDYGSRTGQRSVDGASSDILMCLMKNFKHETVTSYSDLGLCGVYY